MLKIVGAMLVFLSSLPALCQSTPKYQVATITNVSVHESTDKSLPTSYDVSVKVQDTIYVVQYTPPYSLNTVLYSAGRQVLVSVRKDTIRYNDIMGQSFEAPIVSRKPVEESPAPEGIDGQPGSTVGVTSRKKMK